MLSVKRLETGRPQGSPLHVGFHENAERPKGLSAFSLHSTFLSKVLTTCRLSKTPIYSQRFAISQEHSYSHLASGVTRKTRLIQRAPPGHSHVVSMSRVARSRAGKRGHSRLVGYISVFHVALPYLTSRNWREGNIDMSKYIIRCIRYILPLVVLLLIAAYLILAPAVFTHAAGATIQHIAGPHGILPNVFWPAR